MSQQRSIPSTSSQRPARCRPSSGPSGPGRERVLHLVAVAEDLLAPGRSARPAARRSRRSGAASRRPRPPSPRPAPRRRDPGSGSRRRPGSAGTAPRRAPARRRRARSRRPRRGGAAPSSLARERCRPEARGGRTRRSRRAGRRRSRRRRASRPRARPPPLAAPARPCVEATGQPNSGRHGSSPTISTGGRSRASHASRSRRNFLLAHRDAARRSDALARRDVAELLRDARRGERSLERARGRHATAEAAEEQLEHRRAHLGPEAAALEALPEPRAGLGRPRRGEVLGVDRPACPSARRPPRRRAAGASASGRQLSRSVRWNATKLVDEARLADPVRPRDEERHLLGRVDALLGERARARRARPPSAAEARAAASAGGARGAAPDRSRSRCLRSRARRRYPPRAVLRHPGRDVRARGRQLRLSRSPSRAAGQLRDHVRGRRLSRSSGRRRRARRRSSSRRPPASGSRP